MATKSVRTPTPVAAGARCAALAAALCLMLTGCSESVTGRPVAAPDLGHWRPAPTLNARLGNLLLSANDVDAVGQTTNMAVRKPSLKMSHSEDVISDRACLDAYSPIEDAIYRDSGSVALEGQFLDNARSRAQRKDALLQAVVRFRDADLAQKFFTQARPRWSSCANRPLTITQPGDDPVAWTFGGLMATDTTLSLVQTLDRGHGFACQRAVGVRNNVIVDTLWCGFNTTNQAAEVVTRIAAAVEA